MKSYNERVHRLGRFMVAAVFVGSFIPPMVIWLVFGISPNWPAFLKGATTILSIMIPVGIAEFMSYSPIVGSAGYYLMSVSGNFSNIKIPATVTALDAAGVDAKTEEGDALSTIAMAVSTMVTMIIIFIGVLLLTPFTAFFQNPLIRPAFDQVVPALFGALTLAWILKSYKTALIPIVVAVIVLGFSLINSFFTIPAIAALSLIFARIAFKLGFYNPKEAKSAEDKNE